MFQIKVSEEILEYYDYDAINYDGTNSLYDAHTESILPCGFIWYLHFRMFIDLDL